MEDLFPAPHALQTLVDVAGHRRVRALDQEEAGKDTGLGKRVLP